MNRHDHLGYKIRASQIVGSILVPKYYNPEISERLRALSTTHRLVPMASLFEDGVLSCTTGHEIGKMAYGTGSIPFVRTSDISNWEIITNPKQGVSQEIYDSYAAKQGVRAGDILMVRDGTYLIGNCCWVTEADTRMVYQSHILKIRVEKPAHISPELLLAVLSSPVVQEQVKAKQFTADIIDTLGNRYLELVLPIPKGEGVATRIRRQVSEVVNGRLTLRERIRRIPLWAEGIISSPDDEIPPSSQDDDQRTGPLAFVLPTNQIVNEIFIPRYYSPPITERLRQLTETHQLVTIASLSEQGIIALETGTEVGKMAYGTGSIPFIRTSDIANWELKSDPKQTVSEELYEDLKDRQDVRADDLLLVRDGTYLVGTSCILTEYDTRILYCGGLYKIRIRDKSALDPYLLLALLNTPVVKGQVRAKQFTRDVIDTLGKRVYELVLPIPRDAELRQQIATSTREAVVGRAQLRGRATRLAREVEGLGNPAC